MACAPSAAQPADGGTAARWRLSGDVLGTLWGRSWDALGRSGDALGTLWGRSGDVLGTLWDALGHLGMLWDADDDDDRLPFYIYKLPINRLRGRYVSIICDCLSS